MTQRGRMLLAILALVVMLYKIACLICITLAYKKHSSENYWMFTITIRALYKVEKNNKIISQAIVKWSAYLLWTLVLINTNDYTISEN